MRKLYLLLLIIFFISWVCEDIDETLTEVKLWGVYYSKEYTTNLDLSNIGLTGFIPSEIGNLANLIWLVLSDNQLTGSIPSKVGNLTNLFGLFLSDNQLVGSIPPEIGDLTNLTYLGLNSNELTGLIPSEICDLTKLKILNLNNNKLSGFIPFSICDLNLDWSDSSAFSIFSNQLCPPYPSCVKDYVGEQDTSDCP